MTPNNEEVLNSWKEVAAYLGRGVRTVQRWEQELGLPVRRPRGKSRSAVIAFRSEIDKWLHEAPADQLHEHSNDLGAVTPRVRKFTRPECQVKLRDTTQLLISKTHVLVSRSADLCAHLKSLREQVEHTMRLTAVKINRNSESCYALIVAAAPQEKKATPAGGGGRPAKLQTMAS
jgi:predicted DNA-binding transcriptional regulator AlpA